VKPLVDFVKTTLAGGVLFLLPLVLVAFVVGQAFKMARAVLGPVVHLLPAQAIGGVAVASLVAVLGIVLVCFAAGLFVRTRLARAMSGPLERVVLRRMPWYTFFKTVTGSLAGLETGSEIKVALARIEDAWVLSFVLERHASGLFTVFVPSAPTPAAGSVYYLTADRLRPLDVPVTAALKCIVQLGVGSRELLEGAAQHGGAGGVPVGSS
jgi:uncharacterized membrane protein